MEKKICSPSTKQYIRSREVSPKLTVYGLADAYAYISSGSYGTVHLGIFEKTKPVAVKRIQISYEDGKIREQEQELLLKLAGHPNILQYYCYTTPRRNPHLMYLVTELCAGTLDHLVRETYEGPRVGDKREILLQVTKALAYLHENQIAHGDMKPSNIFISRSYGAQVKPRIKLADFGSSGIFRESHRNFPANPPLRKFVVQNWRAPEQYQSLNRRQDYDKYAADIFSTGLIFVYTLSDGNYPFKAINNQQTTKIEFNENGISNLAVNHLMPPYNQENILELIQSMTKTNDPTVRPKVHEVLRNGFFRNQHYDQADQEMNDAGVNQHGLNPLDAIHGHERPEMLFNCIPEKMNEDRTNFWDIINLLRRMCNIDIHTKAREE